MRTCPSCQEAFDESVRFCPNDGTKLLLVAEGDAVKEGKVFADRYEVLEKLGEGTFGMVFKVKDTLLDDVEALKVFDRRRLPPDRAQEAAERFTREARVSRKLSKDSRHIVGVRNFVIDERNDVFCYAMEYVEGLTLTQILSRDGPFTEKRALTVMNQLCEVMEVAHGAGVIHRDIKLDNLMLTRDGDEDVLKVLDFGIAKIDSSDLTSLELGVPGTPGFASPEQLERPGSIDHRSDLFSAGVVLYAMMTGRDPWLGEVVVEASPDSWSLIRASMEKEPRPMGTYRENTSASLERVVMKLLAKNPDDRYESAVELSAALTGAERTEEAERPGTIIVESETSDFTFTLHSGRRTLTEATTPWTSKPLAPGLYQVEVSDPGFMTQSEEVSVRPGDTSEVRLAPQPREVKRRVPAWLSEKVAPSAVGILALVLWVVLRPPPPITDTELRRLAQQGAVTSLTVRGDNVIAEFDDPVRSGEFRVALAGLDLQDLMRDVTNAGVDVTPRGRSRLDITVRDRAADTLDTQVLSLTDEEDGGCDPCGGRVRLRQGWYSVAGVAGPWRLDSLRVSHPDSVYAPVRMRVRDGTRLFVPGGAKLQVVAVVSPSG